MSPVKLVVLAILVGIGFWALMASMVAASLADDWLGWVMNLGTEIVGAVAIYLILDQIIGGRERREAAEREMEAHKKDLIARMGSQVHDVAIEAVDELRRRGWLTDGSLQGKFLPSANLLGADLMGANLQGADLRYANLQRADLSGANLEGAILVRADLQGATLLIANLQGADLWDAKLQGANLVRATFDHRTTVPDRTNWTPTTDMARFTDPTHPDFWRSSSRRSPACQPKEQE